MIEITTIPTALSGTKCPSCDSTKHIKNGKEKGNQKYKCKTCGKNYRNTTGSSIHKIHKKQQLETYIQCLYEGLTLRKAAVKTGISLKTSFAWRHKLLANISQKRENKLTRKTTTANLTLPYSEKGTKKDKENQTANKDKTRHIQCIYQTDYTGKIQIDIHNHSSCYNLRTLGNINECSTSIPQNSLPRLYKSFNIKATKSDIQLAHEARGKLLSWLDKFHGVATKYLHHYWAWYEQMVEFELSENHRKIMKEKCLAKA